MRWSLDFTSPSGVRKNDTLHDGEGVLTDMVKLEHELHLHAYRQGGASRIFGGSLVLEDYLSGSLGNWENFVFDDGAYRVPRGNCNSSHNG